MLRAYIEGEVTDEEGFDHPLPPLVSQEELPWALADSDCWERLVAPYLAAAVEIVILNLMHAESETERAICQGQMTALRQMQDAPKMFEYIRSRTAALAEKRTETLDETSFRRRRPKPRPTGR